ncbi:hypothetical protein [Pantoea sp. OXWO6B1]|uniref:hypothetical protein n=1 Tax=Pantoea TaxID=53335 RepID=UPI0007C7B5A9|nr:hypothetical protein [Pantoea sp. OXWO6B1]OAE09010.1 hypothetical protein A6A26_15940 [Pantoea sp. OXWO6B1]
MKNDIYTEAKKLASLVKKDAVCRSDIADDIIDVVDFGATSAEILMKLKYYTSLVLSDKDKHSRESIDLASAIHSKILKKIV